MGKKEIRTVSVSRRVTLLLLLLVSAMMIAFIVILSGRAVFREPITPARMLGVIINYDRTGQARANLLASLAPVIANALFFMPWGALAFLAFDAPNRRKRMTYALVVVVGVTFALGQVTLPTRVTGWIDTIWNAVGALAGALVGHLRKSVRIRFE
jgi:glycopeptide antibiotics resistance protein